jgi:hypothetical protein
MKTITTKKERRLIRDLLAWLLKKHAEDKKKTLRNKPKNEKQKIKSRTGRRTKKSIHPLE